MAQDMKVPSARVSKLGTNLRTWVKERQTVLAAFAATRVIVIFTTYVANWHTRSSANSDFLSPILTQLGSWDAAPYRYIATNGYPNVTPSTGNFELDKFVYFPLWPFLERVFDVVLPGVGLLGASILLVHLLTLIGILRFRSLLARETGSTALADRASVYLLIFPAAYVLSMGYGDALFLLLSVCFFDAIRRRSWMVASALGILAGLTRAQGTVLALAALIESVRYLREKRDKGGLRLRSFVPVACSIAAPVAGFLLYLGYVQIIAGDFSIVVDRQWQPQWKQSPSFFLTEAIFGKVGQLFTHGVVPNVLLGSIVLMGLGFSLFAFRVLPGSFAAYALVGLVISTSAKSFVSADRYVLMLFPIFWALAVYGKRVWFDVSYRALAPVLMGSVAILAWLGSWVP